MGQFSRQGDGFGTDPNHITNSSTEVHHVLRKVRSFSYYKDIKTNNRENSSNDSDKEREFDAFTKNVDEDYVIVKKENTEPSSKQDAPHDIDASLVEKLKEHIKGNYQKIKHFDEKYHFKIGKMLLEDANKLAESKNLPSEQLKQLQKSNEVMGVLIERLNDSDVKETFKLYEQIQKLDDDYDNCCRAARIESPATTVRNPWNDKTPLHSDSSSKGPFSEISLLQEKLDKAKTLVLDVIDIDGSKKWERSLNLLKLESIKTDFEVAICKIIYGPSERPGHTIRSDAGITPESEELSLLSKFLEKFL